MIRAEDLLELYEDTYREDVRGVRVSRAPGRVNMIGEHTDYNDGFVMPIAIERHIWNAAKPKEGRTIHLFAADYGERTSFNLDDIRFDENHLWANYITGVAHVMIEKGYELIGANMVIKGDIPQGAGLGSSGAMEIAAARIFAELSNYHVDPIDMAYMGKSAENDFVGVQCGIMDQFVSSLGRHNHVLFIDCRTNEYDHIPLDQDFSVVVVNTMIRRELTFSAYNERRRQCEEGVRILRKRLPKIEALRDVSLEELERHENDLPQVVSRRCRHVVSENARVLEAVEALKDGEMDMLGQLMYESHVSLRDDYEVSCRELDVLVEAARDSHAIGARMTGAGFGGCTVNIVRKEHTKDFIWAVKEKYRAATGIEAEVYV